LSGDFFLNPFCNFNFFRFEKPGNLEPLIFNRLLVRADPYIPIPLIFTSTKTVKFWRFLILLYAYGIFCWELGHGAWAGYVGWSDLKKGLATVIAFRAWTRFTMPYSWTAAMRQRRRAVHYPAKKADAANPKTLDAEAETISAELREPAKE